MVEAGERELAPEPEPGRRRVDRDDVDLAERRLVVGVDLGPAEPEPPVPLVEEEALGDSNQSSASCRRTSSTVPLCSGCQSNALLLTRTHASSSRPGRNWPGLDLERLAHGERSPHLPQVRLNLRFRPSAISPWASVANSATGGPALAARHLGERRREQLGAERDELGAGGGATTSSASHRRSVWTTWA